VTPALRFLRAANADEPVWVPPVVVVIGGGNTAMDAARVALRSGARVTVAYRRSRTDMPAHPDEVAQAEREGVRFVFNAAPVAFIGENGAVERVELQRTRPGPPDASGRRRPEPIPGDVFSLAAGGVLTAIGEELELDAFDGFMDIVRGRLQADRWGRTRQPHVFAGGDAATGAGTVVEAIGSGRRVAEAIDGWLAGREVHDGPEQHAVTAGNLNFFYFPPVARARQMVGNLSTRGGFDEVVSGLTWQQAAGEARRCLSCGACTSCSNCVVFCPEGAASRKADGYAIDLAHCKGCGLCVAECPRGAMTLVPENDR
jgi:NADPH-dependent glutamate synthase beta subunit-like oxidoreductase